MDTLMRELERRAAADPADGAAFASLARALARAGRTDEARAAVRTRFTAGEVDADTLALALELGQDAVSGRSAPRPRELRLRPRRRPPLLPGRARRAGARDRLRGHDGARETVLALRDLLGGQVVNTMLLDDELALEVRATLARPWIVTRNYAVRSLKLVTVPVGPQWVKTRRQLLRTASALAFAVDARSPGVEDAVPGRPTNEAAWKVLASDFRRVKGFALDELPLAFLYQELVEEAWHRFFTVAVGLRGIPRVTARIETVDERVVAHRGALEALALLLAGVAAAVRGVAAPRPRFRR